MNIEIANRLVKLRKEKSLSQEALANELGISRQAVSKWERAEASPDLDNMIALAKLYDVSLDDLLKGDQEEFESGRQNKEEPEEEVKENKDSVHISLKEGIHVTDKDGSEVHVGWNGIHVEDSKEGHKVDVDNKGVFVDGEEYDKEKFKEFHQDHAGFPFAIIIVIGFIIGGAFTGLWHPLWLMLLLIPILDGIVEAIKKGDPNKFPYPILVSLVFLYIGLVEGVWHPTWVLFLTIPVYYAITSYFNALQSKKQKANEESQEDGV